MVSGLEVSLLGIVPLVSERALNGGKEERSMWMAVERRVRGLCPPLFLGLYFMCILTEIRNRGERFPPNM